MPLADSPRFNVSGTNGTAFTSASYDDLHRLTALSHSVPTITLWAQATEIFVSATSWPFQNNRTPATVMLLTMLGILNACITARRNFGVRRPVGALRRRLVALGWHRRPVQSPRFRLAPATSRRAAKREQVPALQSFVVRAGRSSSFSWGCGRSLGEDKIHSRPG